MPSAASPTTCPDSQTRAPGQSACDRCSPDRGSARLGKTQTASTLPGAPCGSTVTRPLAALARSVLAPARRRAPTSDRRVAARGDVWNEVGNNVDDHPAEPGRYILAGSAVPATTSPPHRCAAHHAAPVAPDVARRERPLHPRSPSATCSRAADARPPIRGSTCATSRSGSSSAAGPVSSTAILTTPVATQGYLDETRRVDVGRLDGPGATPRTSPGSSARWRATRPPKPARTIAADVAGAEGGSTTTPSSTMSPR